MTKEQQIEETLLGKLQDLKYTYRADIRDRATLEKNFHKKFEALDQIKLIGTEFDACMIRSLTWMFLQRLKLCANVIPLATIQTMQHKGKIFYWVLNL